MIWLLRCFYSVISPKQGQGTEVRFFVNSAGTQNSVHKKLSSPTMRAAACLAWKFQFWNENMAWMREAESNPQKICLLPSHSLSEQLKADRVMPPPLSASHHCKGPDGLFLNQSSTQPQQNVQSLHCLFECWKVSYTPKRYEKYKISQISLWKGLLILQTMVENFPD